MTTPDGFTALDLASATFGERLHLVGPDSWQRPTPCAAWDVRALVNHVIGGNRRYVMLLHGASADAVDRTRAQDHLGSDPISAFTDTASDLAAAFREEGALDRTGHHPNGDRTGSELLVMRVLDLTIHAWDLARAIDVDDGLEAGAVGFALSHPEVVERGREHGSFASPVDPPSQAPSPQARLLLLAGRSIEGDRW